jgi:hypothetical protein
VRQDLRKLTKIQGLSEGYDRRVGLLMMSFFSAGADAHNREFGLDAARAGRLEFSPGALPRPILAGVRAAGRHDTDTESSQSDSR